MLIRRRIEKLERSSPSTIASLIDRIERETMNTLWRDQQRTVNQSVDGVEQSAMERYHEEFSSALKQVSDEDLDRMILYCAPKANRAGLRQ